MESDYETEINYYSNASWTVPAHASMFSGKLPSEHSSNTEKPVFDDRNRLTEKLSELGYRTSLITENFLLTPALGFGEQFDNFLNMQYFGIPRGQVWREIWNKDKDFSSRYEKWLYFTKAIISERDLESIGSLKNYLFDKIRDTGEAYNPTYTSKTIKQIDKLLQDKSEKDLIVTNLMAAHYSCTFNQEQKEIFLEDYDREKIQNLIQRGTFDEFVKENPNLSDEDFDIIRKSYRASIRYLDGRIEEMYENSPEDTVFVVLGDHGEVIGEHSIEGTRIYEHHFGTFKELVDVHFQIFPKNISIEGGKISSHKDLIEILSSLTDGSNLRCNTHCISEYYGRKGFSNYFNKNMPENMDVMFSRRSFSVTSNDYKLDIASEGEKLHKLKSDRLVVKDDSVIKEELKSKIPFVLETILRENNFL